jgi:DNA polymerase-3 subunit delta
MEIIAISSLLADYYRTHGCNTVTSEAIRQVCSRSEESDAFALVNAVLSGKSDAAFEALGDMKRRRIEPIAMLGSISRVYADLISVRVLLDKGLTSYDIASRMKMHEYKAKLYCNSARSAKTEKLKRAIALCLEADLELKSGTMSYLPIEKLVCALSSKDVI